MRSNFIVVAFGFMLTTASGCPDIVIPTSEVSDAAAEVEQCTPYCVGQQAYACNADGVIVAAQVCAAGTQCTGGACIPVDTDTVEPGPEIVEEVTEPDATEETVDDADADAAGDDGPTEVDGTGEVGGDDGDGGCVPACEGLECGDDGCGGTCGDCTGGAVCSEAGQCECTPDSQTVCSDGDSYFADSCGNVGALATGCGGNGCTDGFCDNCIPQCAGLECGSDGCGGSCGDCTGGEACTDGLCACQPQASQDCVSDALYWFDSCGNQQGFIENCAFGCTGGTCDACTPTCGGAECGDDGCGGTCGDCDSGESCVAGACTCTDEATSDCVGGDVYWFDSCGGLGAVKTTCPGFGCTNGACDGCTPDCSGKQCGDDGCGGECGPCTGTGEVCQANQCNCLSQVYTSCNAGDLWHFDSCNNPESVASSCEFGCTGSTCDACQPQCSGKNCGSDGCGGTCGTCTGQDTCNASGQCVCQPDCAGLSCGNDGCGGTCGNCTGQDTCNSGGQCVCQPDCAGKDCGADGCGGSCGSCSGLDSCSAQGQCVCQPSCGGNECGPNGCGGICGTCGSGETCSSGQCESPDLAHMVFTTKDSWAAGSHGGGLARQDHLCQLAGASGAATNKNPRTWIALMSDNTLDIAAASRPKWSGPLGNAAGEILTPTPQTWPFDAENPARFNQDGDLADNPNVATGTKVSGNPTGAECAGNGRAWNTLDGNASLGDAQATGTKFIESGGSAQCNEPTSLYCVNVADTPEHIIFATSWSGPAGDIGGLTQADQICQELGNSFDAERSWVALMSDSVRGIPANQRVGWHGPVINTQGQMVEPNPMSWPWAPLENPVRFDEEGKDLGDNAKAHTGTKNGGTPSGGDCQNGAGTQTWVNNSMFVTAGRVYSAAGNNGWLDGGGIDSCGAKFHIYCVSR